MTPEGRVKGKIDRALKEYEPDIWVHKPVQRMGAPCLDYHCCYKGWYFAIEAKAPGEHPTKRQDNTSEEIQRAGGTVFVITDVINIFEMRSWLDTRTQL
jgi:hypothetical protein